MKVSTTFKEVVQKLNLQTSSLKVVVCTYRECLHKIPSGEPIIEETPPGKRINKFKIMKPK